MNRDRAIRLGLCVMFLGAFLGCKTTYYGVVEKKSEPLSLQPMTMTLVNYLESTSEVRDFQYYLSSRVVLAKEVFEKKPYENVKGSLKLDNTYSRDTVEIDQYTPGTVVRAEKNNGKLVLIVCFGRDPELTLRFIQSGDGDRFDLETQNGNTLYGTALYRVLHDQDFTRLLINVESGGRIVSRQRKEPGRSLWDENEKSPSESKPSQQESTIEDILPADSEEGFSSIPEPSYGRYPYYEGEELPGNEFSDPTPPDTRVSAGPVRYRVQIGAFCVPDNARQTVERLQIAGLNPSCIQENGFYKVTIRGVAEEDMPDIKQQLVSAGFSDPWIREEK